MKKNNNSLSLERDCNIFEYFIRRIFSSIFYYRIYRKIFKNHPFYTPAAIKYISKILNTNSKVFEWGSGASTIWLSKRIKELYSIEHDELWFEKGLLKLSANQIKNVELKYFPPANFNDFNFEKEWKYYNKLKHPPRKKSFFNYMKTIDAYPDYYFDCIIIDGRERVGCLVHALSKLSLNGYIILDDSHRPKYKEFFSILKDWDFKKFNFGLLQTTIFYRN